MLNIHIRDEPLSLHGANIEGYTTYQLFSIDIEVHKRLVMYPLKQYEIRIKEHGIILHQFEASEMWIAQEQISNLLKNYFT